MSDQLLREDEKEALLKRVKDIELVEEKEELRCVKCTKLLIQHYIAECGHAFCFNCRKVVNDGSGLWRCARCQQFIKNIDKQDVELDERISLTSASCPNRNYGCAFVGKLKEVAVHLPLCKDTRESILPVELKREDSVTNRLVDSVSERVNRMEEENRKLRLQRSEDSAVVEELLRRVAECEVRLTSDPERVQKALEERTRALESEMERTKLSQLELTLCVAKMGEVKGVDHFKVIRSYLELEAWRKSAKGFPSERVVLSWKVAELESKPEWLSEVFDLTGYSSKAHARFNIHYTGSVTLSVSPLLTSASALPSRFLCVFKDQTGSGNDYVRAAVIPAKDFSKKAEVTYVCHSSQFPVLHPPLRKDNALQVEIRLEPPPLPVSLDGLLFDRITEYRKLKELARKYIGYTHFSPCFHSAEGHTLHFRLEVDEEGRVEAEVEWLTGSSEWGVMESVLHQATLTLFNPDRGKKRVYVMKERVTFDPWRMAIGSEREVEELLDEDTLYYKVEVKTIDT